MGFPPAPPQSLRQRFQVWWTNPHNRRSTLGVVTVVVLLVVGFVFVTNYRPQPAAQLDVQTLSAQVDTLQKKVDGIKPADNSALESQLSTLSSDVDNLSSDVKSLQDSSVSADQLNQLNVKLDGLNTTLASIQDQVNNNGGNGNGGGDPAPATSPDPTSAPPADAGDGDTNGFQPANCPGDIRLPDGYAGPLNSEIIAAINIQFQGQQGDTVRVGTECSAFHAGIGSPALFSVTCPSQITTADGQTFSDFLCQIGIGDNNFLYWGTGQRVDNARHITIRWVNGFPEGQTVHDACSFLQTSILWGLPAVDDPSFPFSIAPDSGFTCPGVTVTTPGSGTTDGSGNGSNDLAALHCDSAEAVSAVTGIPANELTQHPQFAHGWIWPWSDSHQALTFDVTALGWYRIDWGNNQTTQGKAGPTKGATFWCHA